MHSRYKHLFQRTLAGLVLVLVVLTVGVTLHYRNRAIDFLHAELPELLREAADLNARQKTKYVRMSGPYNEEPERIGDYRPKVFHANDTTIHHLEKIVDMETEIMREKHSYLMVKGDLHSRDVQAVFDSLAHRKEIHVTTLIRTTSHVYKKMNDWSGDSTLVQSDFESAYTQQGIFEDINYYAYSDISGRSVWWLMPHGFIFSLLCCTLLAGGFLLHVMREVRSEPVVTEPVTPESTVPPTGYADIRSHLHIERKHLVFQSHRKRISPQQEKLLLLFLENTAYRVDKLYLKEEMWNGNFDKTNHMTSAINRLRQLLAEVQSPYTIVTDATDKDFYLLIPEKESENTQPLDAIH